MNFSAMMLVMLLVGGGENTGDLLDFTPTQTYWEMRDQRIVDAETMSAVLSDDDATATDILMAIRALGEVTRADNVKPNIKADALKLLTPLAQSKEPFVGQYAKRSIAWIKGEDPEPRKALAAQAHDLDLALMPSDAAFVGQLKMNNGVGPIDLASLIPDIKIEGQSMRDQMMQHMLPGLMQGVEKIGNARADLVTAGFILNSDKDMSFVLAVRGQYDRVGIQMLLEDELGEEEGWSFYSVGEVEVVANPNNYDPVAMLMPSDELFIMMFSESRGAKLPIDDIAKKLGQPDRKPSFDALLAKQVDAVDRDKADVWAAMRVTQFMKNEREVQEVFGAFDAGRAFATRGKEGVLDIQWAAEGSDEAAVGKTVKFFTDSIQEGITEISEQKQHMPAEMKVMMDPMLEMLKSMKFNADGKTMTGGMKVDPGIGMTMPMMMFGMNVRHHDHAEFAVEEAVAE